MVAVAWGVYLAQAEGHNLQRVSLAQDSEPYRVIPKEKVREKAAVTSS